MDEYTETETYTEETDHTEVETEHTDVETEHAETEHTDNRSHRKRKHRTETDDTGSSIRIIFLNQTHILEPVFGS